MTDVETGTLQPATGLRDRKKALRHEEILHRAKTLFADQGIDATTMAEIADAANVSAPTVFNYFGNKDGILIALITEGSRKAIALDVAMEPRTDADFATILNETMISVTVGTLNIASKRIWRYAESASIRHPHTELAREYSRVDNQLRLALVNFIDAYDFDLRSGAPANAVFLADLFFDVWNAAFFELIKDNEMDIETHQRRLDDRFRPLVAMLFEDAFLKHPKLKLEKS